MSDITPAELARLVLGATKKAPFDADTFEKDLAANRRRDCQADLDVHARLLMQRQVCALERIADLLTGPDLVSDIRHNVSEIAWEAGRSFAAGQRMDR